MRKGIKLVVAGLCLGTLLLTGCNEEEGKTKITTEQNKSEDVLTTQNLEETESVDAQVGMIEVCELVQLEGKEIISASVAEEGKTIYLSTCYIDMESVMPVYEVLRYDYQEESGEYAEPVRIEMEEGISCIYFVANQAENKAYMSILIENYESENLEEVSRLHLATAQMEGNRLTNITLLEEIDELGNQIVSGIDEEENIYYITEDSETGMLIAKTAYMSEGYTAEELFQEGNVQTVALEEIQDEVEESEQQDQSEVKATEQQGSEEAEPDMNTDENAKTQDAKDEENKENIVLWEEIIDMRSIVKAEDGNYYFTAPGPKNGIYMIYTTRKQEDGLFSFPELLPKEINDGIEDKLYCTISADQKYLYYISSKSEINDKGEFYSKTMLYRVEREKLNLDDYE